MISAINPVGFNRTVQFKGIEQQPIQEVQSEKKGMSKTAKTMLGLGALAAITVGGLLAKKHIDTKAIKSLIERPQEFNETYYKDFLKKWFKKLNLEPDAKGEISLMSKEKINEIIADMRKKGHPLTQLEKVSEHMSDNGILAMIKASDKCYFKYLDPEKISLQVSTEKSGLKNLTDIFAEGKMYVRNFVTDAEEANTNFCLN